jgi:hypothetical protein
MLGVEHKRVQSYIDSGQLKATFHDGRRPGHDGLARWHIMEKDLRSFVIRFCQEFNGRNVDLMQIVFLVLEGERA